MKSRHTEETSACAIDLLKNTTWQNSVTYNEIIRLSGILDEAQTTIPPYERPKIAKSCEEPTYAPSRQAVI
jgi:hypothetical protein